MHFSLDMPLIINGVIVTGAQIIIIVILLVVLQFLSRFFFKMVEKKRPTLLKDMNIERAREKIKKSIRLGVLGGVLFLLVANSYLMFVRKEDLLHTVTSFFSRLSLEFWQHIAVRSLKLLLAIILAKYVNKFSKKLILAWETKAKNYEQLQANDESISRFFLSLKRIIKNTLILLLVIFAVTTFSLPVLIPTYLFIVLKIYLIVSIGLLVVTAASAVTDSLYGLSRKYWYRDSYKEWYERLSKLLPLLQRCLEYIIYAWAASLAILQLDFISQFASYGPVVVQIIGIFFISRVVLEVVKLLVDKAMSPSGETSTDEEQQRQTLIPVIKSLFSFGVYFIAFVLILRAMQINPMPFLAGAGLLGAVVGLGAQPIINDVVSGFFILFEQLFLVGDFVEIDQARGTVELIEIRTTLIRDPDGQLHIIRNGQINQVVNYSKKYTHAVVEVGVAYDSDLDQVYRVLEQVGRQIKDRDPNVVERLRVRGLKEYGESELLIRTLTKVKPGSHLEVSFKLRKMIKEAFDREGIEIPFARRVLIFHNEEEKDTMVSDD